jgi:transposase
MMGKSQKTQPKLFYHGLSLEQRMPKDDPLRKIKQLVDFNFVRSQVADLYGNNGNQSVDPAVILKLMFLLFYENVSSERALMRKLPLRMDWLWFCDYDLDEDTPDHSVLSKARKRWGPEVFEQFFMNILKQCISAGLVDGETIYIDSSTIDANADIDKVRPQLRKVTEELTDKFEDVVEPCKKNNTDEDKLEKRVNPVDPDARIGRKYGKNTLGYKDHRVIDDKHGVITTTISTPANTRDDKVLKQAVHTHQAGTATRVRIATADKIYGTIENYKFLNNKGSKACIPHQRYGIKKAGKFSHDMFKYDKRDDCFICPADQKLERYDRKLPSCVRIRYRAERKVCEGCKFFSQCVTGKTLGRQVERNINAEYIEWADSCLSRYQRKQLMSRRQCKSEGSFANAANNHGFKRARWRGLDMVRIQNNMIAAIQNIGKLLRYSCPGDKLTATAMLIKAFFKRIARVLPRLLSIYTMYERILSYQRAKPAYIGKLI